MKKLGPPLNAHSPFQAKHKNPGQHEEPPPLCAPFLFPQLRFRHLPGALVQPFAVPLHTTFR